MERGRAVDRLLRRQYGAFFLGIDRLQIVSIKLYMPLERCSRKALRIKRERDLLVKRSVHGEDGQRARLLVLNDRGRKVRNA